MARNNARSRYQVTDELWARIEPLLPKRVNRHRFGGGRPRAEDRRCLDAILFVLRTGCQWQALDATGICPHSTAHDRYQEWRKAGVFARVWAAALDEYDEVKGIDWCWQSMDGAMTKAPLGGGKNRPQSHGSGQAGGEAERAHGGQRDAHRVGR
jgi:putative transposase